MNPMNKNELTGRLLELLADWARGAAEDAASDLAYMFTETEPE